MERPYHHRIRYPPTHIAGCQPSRRERQLHYAYGGPSGRRRAATTRPAAEESFLVDP